MADDFLPPLEIPWTLAATTQPLAPFEPGDNAISMFWYLPDDKALTSEFPNDRIVYLKFVVTASPAPVPPNVPLPRGIRARRQDSLLPPAPRPQGPQSRRRARLDASVFPRRCAHEPPHDPDGRGWRGSVRG